MVKYFDFAFRLSNRYPKSPVLTYALGMLFRLRCPHPEAGRIAQSCISQALLCEPGVAQKAFALLSYWSINGFQIDASLWIGSINRLVAQHEASGVTSDVAWALAFCLEHHLSLSADTAKCLSSIDDDCVALQALHMKSSSLLPRGFDKRRIARMVADASLDKEHWLLVYESVRHGFLATSKATIAGNRLFAELLARKITFYRTQLPRYALVIQPGGAPEWVVRHWLEIITGRQPSTEKTKRVSRSPIVREMRKDLRRVGHAPASIDDTLANLMDAFEPATELAVEETHIRLATYVSPILVRCFANRI